VLVNLIVLIFAFCIGASRYLAKKSSDRIRIESQAQTIEDASSYNKEDWKATLDKINRNYIPGFHCLVFWYTSTKDARSALECGIHALESIPGIADTPGIVFTLNNFIDNRPDDTSAFPERKVMLACSVRRSLLSCIEGKPKDSGSCIEGKPEDSGLRILSGDVLRALRSKNFDTLTDSKPWLQGEVFLPPQQIVRAYKLESSTLESCSKQPTNFLTDADSSCRKIKVYVNLLRLFKYIISKVT